MSFSEWMGLGALILAAVALIVVAVQARHMGNSILSATGEFIAELRVNKTWLDNAEAVGKKIPVPIVNVADAIFDLCGKLLPTEYQKIAHDIQAITQMITDGQENYVSAGQIEKEFTNVVGKLSPEEYTRVQGELHTIRSLIKSSGTLPKSGE